MPLIAVVARRAFVYGGCDCQPGDRVDVSPVDAVVLVTARMAVFAKPAPVRASVPASPRVAKRAYKRRDLTAES